MAKQRNYFSHNIEAKILGKDTLCTDLFDYQFKLLVYIDTVGCTPLPVAFI